MTGVQTCALPICFPVTIISSMGSWHEKNIESKVMEEHLNALLVKKASDLPEHEKLQYAKLAKRIKLIEFALIANIILGLICLMK